MKILVTEFVDVCVYVIDYTKMNVNILTKIEELSICKHERVS